MVGADRSNGAVIRFNNAFRYRQPLIQAFRLAVKMGRTVDSACRQPFLSRYPKA